MGLSGAQMQAFDVALRDAYRSRYELRRFLRFKLDEKLDDIVGPEGLETVVLDLLERAEAGGWLERLYEKACEDKPKNLMLKNLGRILRLSSSPARQRSYELLDTSNFDLRDLVDTFWKVRYETGGGGLLGFLVRNLEEVLLDKLCKRLEQALDPAEHKATLTLSAEFNSFERPLRILAHYKPDLADRNVLCIVRVNGEVATFEQFWRALGDEFQGLQRFLVLIFAGTGSTVGPVGITELPTPKFERYQIVEWTNEVSKRLLGWSEEEAKAWAELIITQSLDEQRRLDPYYLYDSLDVAVKKIMADQEGYCRMLRHMLRERSRGAIPTSH